MCHRLVLLLCLLAGGFSASTALAQDSGQSALAAEREDIQGQQKTQDSLREKTAEIIRQLDAIILEYERNGIRGEDLEALKRTRQMLAESSIEEMREVVRRLERAAAARSRSGAVNYLTRAYEGQQGILGQLRDLLGEYNKKRDTSLVPILLRELAERQKANMELGVNVAKSIDPRKDLTQFERTSISSQYEEQRRIGEEFTFILSTMEILAGSDDPKVAPLYQAALRRVQQEGIVATFSRALSALDQEQVFSAVSNQNQAYRQLLTLARFLTPRQPASEVLRSLAQRVRKILEDEKTIRKQVAERLDNQRHMREFSAFQGQLVLELSNIRAESNEVAPLAEPAFNQSIAHMQEAQVLMQDKNPGTRKQAPGQVDKAVASLERLLALLLQAAEDAAEQEQQAARQNADPEELDRLAERLERVIELQETLNGRTRQTERDGGSLSFALSEQKRIRELTNFLVNMADASAPEIVPTLSRAAGHMAGAIEAIPIDAQARVAVERQARALAMLEQAREQLASEQAAQEELLAQAEAAEQGDPEALEEAEDALNDAQQAAENAEENLEADDTEEAVNDIEEGLEALDRADQAGQEQTDAARDESEEASQEADDAQQQGEEAQQEAEDAQQEGEDARQEGEDAEDQAEGEPLDEEEGEPGEEEAEGEQESGIPEDASEAAQRAREALEEAREELAEGDEEGAKEAVEEAIEALEEAREAVDEAQAEAAEASDLLAEIEEALAEPEEGEDGEAQEGEEGELAEAETREGEPRDGEAEDGESQDDEQPTEVAETGTEPTDENDFSSTGEKTRTGETRSLEGGAYTALPPRDRQAIEQSLSEEYPEEYEAFIQQYRRNLAEGAR